jgi:hypothetical protein
MAYRLLENGNRPTVDVEDGTEARRELERLVDSAGLTNILFALSRFTSDRYKALQAGEPASAACWLESSRALFQCGSRIDQLWQPSREIDAASPRAATAERIGTQVAATIKRWLR